MVPSWVLISVAAAFLQNVRSGTQRHLTAQLSTTGASATRFIYGLPFALVYLIVLVSSSDDAIPHATARFASLVTLGACAQIIATALLLACFSSRSFAAGTTYSKTEGIQAALFGFLVLGDRVSPGGLLGILASMLGVMLVSLAPGKKASASTVTSTPIGETKRLGVVGVLMTRGAVMGLSSGALFALSAVCYRGAALELGSAHFTMQAAYTLVASLGLQCLILVSYLSVRERGELTRIATFWRRGLLAGATGAAASACWFTAFTLSSAAYVKAVGSVELIFAMLTSWLMFRETPSGYETAGALLVMLGVVLTMLATL